MSKIGCQFTKLGIIGSALMMKLGIISSEVLWVPIHETGYHRFRINDETGYHWFRINDETGYHQFRRFAASEKAKDLSRHQSRRVQVKGKSKTGDE